MLDPVSTASRTTIMRRGTTLSTLPHSSEVGFGDRPPWAPISTAALVAALGADRGNWATWVCRGGIIPAPMPLTWFRPSPGRPRCYQISTVMVWLAGRHGEHTDSVILWRAYLATHVGLATDAPEEAVRTWAQRLAKSAGPSTDRFTNAGFGAYLDSLLRSDVP
jgi:hypothetical protein